MAATAGAGSVNAPPPPPGNLSPGDIGKLWHQAGGSDASTPLAIAVALAESGGNVKASNTAGNSAGTDRGLWQINSFYHKDVTDTCAYDPLCNAKAAVAISNGGTNWNAWSTFKNGTYKKYLHDAAVGSVQSSGSGLPNVGGAIDSVPKFLAKLTDPKLWLKVIEVIGGLILILFALHELSGGATPDPRKIRPVPIPV